MSKDEAYTKLDMGPTWREIVVEALGSTELDTCMWSKETRGLLADHILAALRKQARGPFEDANHE